MTTLQFKVTMPSDSGFAQQKFMNRMRQIGNKLADRVHHTYGELTTYWHDVPQFTKNVQVSPNEMIVKVQTTNLKYRFVDLGTKAHPITPKNAPMLVFPLKYTSVTKVESLHTRHGGKDYNGPWIHTDHVEHKGTQARNFEKPINEEQIPLVQKDFNEIMKHFKLITLETERYD